MGVERRIGGAGQDRSHSIILDNAVRAALRRYLTDAFIDAKAFGTISFPATAWADIVADVPGDTFSIEVGPGLALAVDTASKSIQITTSIGNNTVLGRSTAGTGEMEQLAATAAGRAMLAAANATAQTALLDEFAGSIKGLVPVSAGGTVKFLRADGSWALIAIADGDYGDITVSAIGATWTIDAGTVTLAKMANIATDRLIGRDTAGTGVPEALTVGGGVEFSGAGGIQRSALTGDVTASAGSNATTIANDAVTYAKMQNVSATDKVLGRSTAGAGDVEEIACTAAGRAIIAAATAAAQTALLDLFTAGLKGLVPASGGGTTNFLRADGTFAAPGGGGGGNAVQVVVNFGASFTDRATTTVTGQAWVTALSAVSIAPFADSVDLDEIRLLGFTFAVSNLVVGTGFDLTVFTDAEAKGNYSFLCVGA